MVVYRVILFDIPIDYKRLPVSVLRVKSSRIHYSRAEIH